jgi:hypothetical protein
MRKSFVIAAALAAAWTVVPSATTVLGLGSLAAAVSLLVGSEAAADTALLPGWVHSCGRNPRCFERGEARRQARRNAQYMRTQ